MIPLIDERLEAYAVEHTSDESELMSRLAAETAEKMTAHRMLTGKLQGTFLKLLVKCSDPDESSKLVPLRATARS